MRDPEDSRSQLMTSPAEGQTADMGEATRFLGTYDLDIRGSGEQRHQLRDVRRRIWRYADG